ncbi:MAG: glycosyltransferase family 4 protein [Ignavibacteriales bacterium]|nr:glycosyltransferase family 4 protein [Ignavibacteriales bacterium]
MSRCVGAGWLRAFQIPIRVLQADLMFVWFASVYGAVAVLAAALMGKKSILIIAGVDVADEPQLGYGLWRSWWKSKVVALALRQADQVLAVDESLRSEVMQRARYAGGNIEVVPTGYDAGFWKPDAHKERLVLTVAVVSGRPRFLVKGIDLLFSAARALPREQFVLIGVDEQLAAQLGKPTNVRIIPFAHSTELRSWYQRAKVFCLPSRREGLSNSLCEAMLCGCTPVATRVGGNGAAIENTGYVISPDRQHKLPTAIEAALNHVPDVNTAARERISTLFPQSRRHERLHQIVDTLLNVPSV